MTTVNEIGRSKYISLVTYRRNGTPVATPVWHVLDDGELFIITGANSGKVKRIRNNNQVMVTVCDIRGRTTRNAPSLPGQARLLDDGGTQKAITLLAKKYPLYRVGRWLRKALRLSQTPTIGVVVSFT